MAISNIGPSWTLGDRLAKARREAGIQAQEMADIFGVSRNSISAWEHDAVEVKASTVARWAEVTGVSVAWLLPYEHNGDGRGPHRAPAAGAASLPVPVAKDDDEDSDGSQAVAPSKKNGPTVLVTSSWTEGKERAKNEPSGPWRTPGCTSDHASEGEAA